jgi:ribosomal protein S18 acetylase RimI-like enzyme
MDVYVIPERRETGLGKKLMRIAERRAAELGVTHISLRVGVDNAAARGFYDSLGFAVETLRMGKEI